VKKKEKWREKLPEFFFFKKVFIFLVNYYFFNKFLNFIDVPNSDTSIKIFLTPTFLTLHTRQEDHISKI
jgi:hypothetical protein